MNAITQALIQQLSGPAISALATKFGLNQQVASTIVSAAVPMIVSALARNTQDPNGAQALNTALQNDNHGSVLEDVMGFLGGNNASPAANGAGILGHILGGGQNTAVNNLAQNTGVDPAAAGGVLQTLAPLVMGMLNKTQQQQGLDANGLASYLNNQQQQAQTAEPGIMGAITSMLDSDHDGSALDDIAGLAGKLFGR